MKKHIKRVLVVVFTVILVLAMAGAVYLHYGGFGTGEKADVGELTKYAAQVEEIDVPNGTKIVALGEATHGNKEFQELKLDVFKHLVEEDKVRALVLESDYGNCEVVDRYIHGAKGTATEAAASLGFQIYRTDEMAELIQWMRSYNEQAAPGEDLKFYGCDMQRYDDNIRYLIEDSEELGIDTAELHQIWNGKDWTRGTDSDQQKQIIQNTRAHLEALSTSELQIKAIHHADILLQNFELGEVHNQEDFDRMAARRDAFMAENTRWCMDQEVKRGNDCIFLTGHNGHIEETGTNTGGKDKVLGNLLSDLVGKDAYFAIGTDFYQSECNVPKTGVTRTTRTVFSGDPLAKAAKEVTDDEPCWLDFSKVPKSSDLRQYIDGPISMGSLGENPYSGLNGLFMMLPQTYRIYREPATMYDGMIFVAKAHPTVIEPAEERAE